MTDAQPRYDGHDLEALADMPAYQDWILSFFRDRLHGRVVEYGAGIGNIARMVRPWTDHMTLVEPAGNLMPQLRDRFKDDDAVEIVNASIESHAGQAGAESCDAVMLVNVLEHVQDDKAALKQFHRIIKPGGSLLLFVPAQPALYSDMDEVLGHHRRYIRDELRSDVENAGFQVETCRYVDLIGSLAWWIVFTRGGAVRFDPKATGVYDRLIVPIMRRIEKTIEFPWAKNIVLTARKTA